MLGKLIGKVVAEVITAPVTAVETVVEEVEKVFDPTCPRCGRDLHGYRGPLCRYCDPRADSE